LPEPRTVSDRTSTGSLLRRRLWAEAGSPSPALLRFGLGFVAAIRQPYDSSEIANSADAKRSVADVVAVRG
jgi:hypothetical protein